MAAMLAAGTGTIMRLPGGNRRKSGTATQGPL
jgi:hypothetical protein